MSDERPDEQPADEKPGDGLPTHIQRADGLTHKQEAAIIALLNEPTVSKAAVACGLNDRTIYRWLDESAFSKAYRKARREAFAQAIAATQRYAPVAVQTLAKIMTDPTLSASARVSAATSLLKFSRESIELDDLATRVDDLEKSMKQEAEQKPPTAAWGDNACA
jgi:hypothetical protein